MNFKDYLRQSLNEDIPPDQPIVEPESQGVMPGTPGSEGYQEYLPGNQPYGPAGSNPCEGCQPIQFWDRHGTYWMEWRGKHPNLTQWFFYDGRWHREPPNQYYGPGGQMWPWINPMPYWYYEAGSNI